MQSAPRFQRIQALRFVAAAAVVAYHAQLTVQSYFGGAQPFPILEFGVYGVDLFFVISGFIIVYIGSTRETAASLFARRRIERIVPMYWLFSAAMFALSYVPGVARSGMPGVAHFAKSLLFISWLDGPGTYPVLNVGWTLEYEMLFYAVAAAAMALTRRPWAVAAAVMLLLVATGHGTPFFLQNPMILEFVFGMTIAAFVYDRRLFPWLLGGALLVLVTLPMVGAAWRVWAFGTTAAIVVAIAVAADRRRMFSGRVLPELGNASYSIYLVHVVVISFACKVVAKLVPAMPAAVTISAVSLLSIGIGYATYRLVEKRLLAAFHRRRRATRDPRGHAGCETLVGPIR